MKVTKMKLLSECQDWQVYQSDINEELVFICQKNNDIGSLNMTIKKDSLQSLVQVLSNLLK
jgi:hypothetical protein